MKHEEPQVEKDIIIARKNGRSPKETESQCLQREARALRGAIGRSVRDLKHASLNAADPRYWFRHHPVASTAVTLGAAAWIGLRVFQTVRGERSEARVDEASTSGLGRSANRLFSSASKAAKSALLSAVVARFTAEPAAEPAEEFSI